MIAQPNTKTDVGQQVELFNHYPSQTYHSKSTPSWKHDLDAPRRELPEEMFPLLERMQAKEFRLIFRAHRGWSLIKVVDLPVYSKMLIHTFKAKPTAIRFANEFINSLDYKAELRIIEPQGSQKLTSYKNETFNKYGYKVVAKGVLKS